MNMGHLNYRSSAVPGTVLLGRTKINPLYSLVGQIVRCFSLFVGQVREWVGQMSVTDRYFKACLKKGSFSTHGMPIELLGIVLVQ